MKYFFFFFLFLHLSCGTSSKKNLNQKTAYHIQAAKGYLLQCLYPQALKEMKSALTLEPKSYIVNDGIGVVYFLMEQYKTARGFFLEAISMEPHYTEARVNLAQTLIKTGQLTRALTQLKKAQEDLTYTNPSKVQFVLGRVYFHQNKLDLAEKHLKTSFHIAPQNCSSHFYLGRVYFEKKKYKKAIEQFQQVRKCKKNKKISPSRCEAKMADHYYFQALSEVPIGQIKSARRNLKLFIKKAANQNPYMVRAEKFLKQLGKK